MTVYYRYYDMNGGIYLQECPVVKKTRCGVWVLEYDSTAAPRHFVNNSTLKRYAYPTKEEAQQSFMARKRRQIGILGAQLRNASEALRRAEAGDWSNEEPLVLTVEGVFNL